MVGAPAEGVPDRLQGLPVCFASDDPELGATRATLASGSP